MSDRDAEQLVGFDEVEYRLSAVRPFASEQDKTDSKTYGLDK